MLYAPILISKDKGTTWNRFKLLELKINPQFSYNWRGGGECGSQAEANLYKVPLTLCLVSIDCCDLIQIPDAVMPMPECGTVFCGTRLTTDKHYREDTLKQDQS